MPRRRRTRPSLLGTVARTAAISGTATAVSERVRHRNAAAAATAPAPAPGPVDESVRLQQLRELGALRDSGVLTEEEFALEKRRILL